MTLYPEHEKLKKIQHLSQSIGEFIDWLRDDKDVVLAKYQGDGLRATLLNNEKYLYEFFGINFNKLEQEKRDMLEQLRGAYDIEA